MSYHRCTSSNSNSSRYAATPAVSAARSPFRSATIYEIVNNQSLCAPRTSRDRRGGSACRWATSTPRCTTDSKHAHVVAVLLTHPTSHSCACAVQGPVRGRGLTLTSCNSCVGHAARATRNRLLQSMLGLVLVSYALAIRAPWRCYSRSLEPNGDNLPRRARLQEAKLHWPPLPAPKKAVRMSSTDDEQCSPPFLVPWLHATSQARQQRM